MVACSRKPSALRAAEAVVIRCPPGCDPALGGPWVPAFAGKPRGRKAGPRNRGVAVVTERTSAQRSIPPAGCPGPLERQHPPCCGGCGGPMSFWLPPSAPWSLGPGVRRENDEINRRQIRTLSRFPTPPCFFFAFLRLPFVSPAKAGA